MTRPTPAILQQNWEVQVDLGVDFRIPFRPNFRSISPQKPEPFRSLEIAIGGEDANRDVEFPIASKRGAEDEFASLEISFRPCSSTPRLASPRERRAVRFGQLP